MWKANLPQVALLGAGLAVALVGRAQEQTPTPALAAPAAVTPEPDLTPTPAVEPMATMTPEGLPPPAESAASASTPQDSPGPAPGITLPCAPSPTRGFFSRPQVPMPAELQGDVLIVKTGSIRIGRKPPSLKPYVVKGMKAGPVTGGSASQVPAWVSALTAQWAFRLNSVLVKQSFSFQLATESSPEEPIVGVRCAWGMAWTTGGLSVARTGFEMRIPQGDMVLCELSGGRDPEPWTLFLWVGPPTDPLVPQEFPSGGGLARGTVRFDATSTNAVNPSLLGLKPAQMTGTFFTREGRAVAAVERLIPGRVLMPCSTPAAEQSLFAAVGAALFIRDGEAGVFDH